jgi:acetamidase/formamidase
VVKQPVDRSIRDPGAEPGDTLVVKFLDHRRLEQGCGRAGAGFSAEHDILHPDAQRTCQKIWFDIDPRERGGVHAGQSVHREDPAAAVPRVHQRRPAGGEARSSVVPPRCGGNMDASEARPGYTLYLPVNAPGALLYLGDGHAAQGDGEVAGTAIEVPLRVRLQVDLIKRKKIAWPRFENDASLMAVGAYRPLDDALRIAFTELVGWIHADYGLSEMDAYELLSKVAKIHLVEMVDPNYVVIAAIDKRYLPVKR